MSPATLAVPVLAPGLHAGIPREQYLAIDALGSSRLEWLNVSPLLYRYLLEHPPADTDAEALGTAVHTLVLEPELFERSYVLEPLDVAAGNAKPRATKAYKEAVADIEQGGFTVLRQETMEKVQAMAAAVCAHEHAAALLARAPERELTLIWEEEGRRGRGRVDLLGDRVAGDLKTTRSLRDFSPWVITRYGYHRQGAWYDRGLTALARPIDHYFLVAVESSAPHDVGVFVFERAALVVGHTQVERLLERLADCEASGLWPGQFPRVAPATISDELLLSVGEEVA